MPGPSGAIALDRPRYGSPGPSPGRGRSRKRERPVAVKGASHPLGPQGDEASRRVEDSAGNRHTVFDQADRHAPFRDSGDELFGSIKWIHNPNPLPVQAIVIIDGLLGQPALTRFQEHFSKGSVTGQVSFGDRVVIELVGSGDSTGLKSSQDLVGRFQRLADALEVADPVGHIAPRQRHDDHGRGHRPAP